MNRILLIGLSCTLFFARPSGYSQEAKSGITLESVPHGISWQAWKKMNDRWQPYSTRVFIQKNDGSSAEGQLTWMSDSLIMIQKNFDLPDGLMNPAGYTVIPVGQIALMKVRLGGQPFKGLIIGMLTGVIPGFVTGAILAQGWTIIPAIVFGAVTSGGGGAAGTLIQKAGRKQTLEIKSGELTGSTYRRLKHSALFPIELPKLPSRTGGALLPDFENLVKESVTIRHAFPDNPFTFSIHSSIMTNSVRKRLQNWYMSPLWGPPDAYYETRIGLEADFSRRIGKRFQAGILFQLFPGDISSTFFDNYLPEWNVSYSYTHHFKQTTFGVYGGWLLQPTDPYWATRLEVTIQAGAVVSDVYEHFYFQWYTIDSYHTGETFVQKHNFQPGAFMRIKTSWYLIPGFSIDTGMEGFLIKRVLINERTVLPETAYGPEYITRHKLNFSNLQGFIGFSIHF
jgi:hypothetical protein